MFNKMVKMKNKKGFTLIEMLIVIAIIAILVSIVIPVVSHSTVKSAAATNAANLRSIEGQLSTMRVASPLAFNNVVEQFGTNFSEMLSEWNIFDESQVDRISNFITIIFGGVIEDYLESGWFGADLAKYRLYHNTADENGTLTIPSENPIVLENVPAAKEVHSGNMYIPEGTPMTIYITEDAIVATYEYGTGNYTRMDFAEVAETGEYSGSAAGSGGITEDQLEHDELGQHTFDKCTCVICNRTIHQGDSSSSHDCSVCGLTGIFTDHVLYDGGDVVKCSKTSNGSVCTHTEAKHTYEKESGCGNNCVHCGEPASDIHHN